MREQCVQDGQTKGKGKGKARGQMHGPLGNPTKEELIMSKSDKAVELVDTIFDEGFEDYSKIKAAEKHVDFLLDMCGAPHGKKTKKKLKEGSDPLASSMYVTGRHYDHPRKIRVKPVADVNTKIPKDDEKLDVSESGPVHGEEEPDDFKGAGPNDIPGEESAKEMTPQKKQNKINHVPNQNASSLIKDVRGEMVEEIRNRLKEDGLSEFAIGSKASKIAILRAKKLQAAYRAKGQKITLKQANRMAAARG